MGSIASINSSKTRESWTLAPVSQTASGMPWRSTTRWRFEPDLPRSVGFGPTSWSGPPPFGRDAGAVQAGTRPVDLVNFTELVQEEAMQAMPHASLLPLTEAAPTGDSAAAAQFLRQVLPR